MTTKLFSLSCKDEPMLLARILQHFTRPGYAVHTLTQSRTDISDIVLISLEVAIPGAAVDTMIKKLERIIGVLAVTVSFGSIINCAVYRLLPSALNGELCALLNGFQARLLNVGDHGHLLVHQIGQAKDIDRLRDALDGPELVAFCSGPVPVSQPLEFGPLDEVILDRSVNHAG